MTAVPVTSAKAICRKSLGLDDDDPIPTVKIVDESDPHRSLKLVVPLDSLQATWVEYMQSAIMLDEYNTLFVIHPPFDEDAPPRFTLYFPDDDDKIMTHVKLSVVRNDKPFECHKRATWSVFSSKNRTKLAEGPIVERTKTTVTIADMDSEKNIMFTWPNKKLQFESRQSSTFRTGIDDSPALMGSCLSGVPRVLGLRYGLSRGLSARLTYMLNIERTKYVDFPHYSCVLNRQFFIENNSDVTFSQVSNIVIASETYRPSDDGYRTRELQMNTQIINPLFMLHATMMTILPGSKHYINETVFGNVACHVVCTVDDVPFKVGQSGDVGVCMWFPTPFLIKNMPQPAASHIHIRHREMFFDDIIGMAPWFQNTEQEFRDTQWKSLSLNTTTHRMRVTCTRQIDETRVAVRITNFFQETMIVAFATYPGHPERCNHIEATKNAHTVDSYPWETSELVSIYTLFVVDAGPHGSEFIATFPVVQ